MDDTASDLEILIARVDSAINQHQQSRDPNPQESERLNRWKRELLLQLADDRRKCWGD